MRVVFFSILIFAGVRLRFKFKFYRTGGLEWEWDVRTVGGGLLGESDDVLNFLYFYF